MRSLLLVWLVWLVECIHSQPESPPADLKCWESIYDLDTTGNATSQDERIEFLSTTIQTPWGEGYVELVLHDQEWQDGFYEGADYALLHEIGGCPLYQNCQSNIQRQDWCEDDSFQIQFFAKIVEANIWVIGTVEEGGLTLSCDLYASTQDDAYEYVDSFTLTLQ